MEMPDCKKPEVSVARKERLSCADGRSLSYIGRGKFDILLGPLKLEKELIIADIEDHVLLELIFCKRVLKDQLISF